MVIDILGSSSSGNCYLIQDCIGHQLLLECGISYDDIIENDNLDFLDLSIILISHFHKDHSCAYKEFKELDDIFRIYSPLNVKAGETIKDDIWNIAPFPCTHNVECFGYIIHNKIENKSIVFATDTTSLPNITDRPFDCMLLECNYNYDKVIENAQNGKLQNTGYKNHMALEDLVQWLRVRECKPKHLVAIHLSNNGNIDKGLVLQKLKPFGENIYIAKKGVKIEI